MLKKTERLLDAAIAITFIVIGLIVSTQDSEQGIVIIALGIIIGYLGDISRDIKRFKDDKED